MDDEGYLEFARSLPKKEIYQAISQAKPVGPIFRYARTENMRRRYDQVTMLPEGMLGLSVSLANFLL